MTEGTDDPHAVTYVRADSYRHPSRPVEEEDPIWEMLRGMHDDGEFERLHRMVKVFEGLEAIGTIGSYVGRFLTWVAVLAAGYVAFSGVLTGWLKGTK